MYGNVHNIFIDHVNHSGESNQHHHHGPGDNDILIHHDDECDNDHDTPITIHYDFGSDYIKYGPANHIHDKPATKTDDYDNRSDHIGSDDFVTSTFNLDPTHPDNIVPPSTGNRPNVNIEWADNIDNVTGGDPANDNAK